MGKATILENIGAGRYRIKVHFDNAQVDALLAYNESIIVTLGAQIADNAIKKAEAWDDYQYHLSYLTTFIVDAGPIGILARQDEVHHAMGTVTQKKAAYDTAVHTEALSKLRLQKATKEIEYLTKYCPKEIEAYAWCVAYNEDLTGEQASIEVDYVLHRDVSTQQIRDHTGFWLFEEPTPPTTILQHPLSTSEHANWFNLCMAPAAQRYKGLYRIAVIIRIDYNLNECDLGFVGYYNVDRFAQERYIRDMPIHPNFDVYGAQQVEYRGAKIEYMGGGAETFLVEDRVIVDLHAGVGVPTVIGYYENPRQGGSVTVAAYYYTGEVSGSGTYVKTMYLKFAFSGSSSSWRYSQTSYTNGGSASYTVNYTKPFTGLPGTCWIDSSINYSKTHTESGVAAGRTVTSISAASSTITIACYVNSLLLRTLVLPQTYSSDRSIAPGSYSNIGSRISYILNTMTIKPTSIIYDITREERISTGYFSSGNKISVNTKVAHYQLKYTQSDGDVILDMDGNPSSIEALNEETTTIVSDGISYLDSGHEFTTDQGATTTYIETFDGLSVLGNEFINAIPT